mmetsp:Transcript_25162/g.73646  ORF Transcript_25162/g.73646 Transcript_25162/m.73646 type:complete len:230 (+) Transcript_25162:368-1057(+)
MRFARNSCGAHVDMRFRLRPKGLVAPSPLTTKAQVAPSLATARGTIAARPIGDQSSQWAELGQLVTPRPSQDRVSGHGHTRSIPVVSKTRLLQCNSLVGRDCHAHTSSMAPPVAFRRTTCTCSAHVGRTPLLIRRGRTAKIVLAHARQAARRGWTLDAHFRRSMRRGCATLGQRRCARADTRAEPDRGEYSCEAQHHSRGQEDGLQGRRSTNIRSHRGRDGRDWVWDVR